MTGFKEDEDLDAALMDQNYAEEAARNADGIVTTVVDTGSTAMPSMEHSLSLPALTPTPIVKVLHRSPPGFMNNVPESFPTLVTA